jgi:hypothetical protein
VPQLKIIEPKTSRYEQRNQRLVPGTIILFSTHELILAERSQISQEFQWQLAVSVQTASSQSTRTRLGRNKDFNGSLQSSANRIKSINENAAWAKFGPGKTFRFAFSTSLA